jgi:hypothetical protein
MKSEQIHLTLFIFFILSACSSGNVPKTVSSPDLPADTLQAKSNIDNQVEKTIKFDHGFEIKVGRNEDLAPLQIYSLFILTHNNKQIYIDSSFTEYELGDSLYPIVRAIDHETFEVLVEINDRPLKNYVKYFKVFQDQIIYTEKMPTFFPRALNLDEDENLELAGFWGIGETWGDNYSLTGYDPIIYFEIKPTGITLDSALTISKNREFYGEFYGFKYNGKIEFKTSETIKREDEILKLEEISSNQVKMPGPVKW